MNIKIRATADNPIWSAPQSQTYRAISTAGAVSRPLYSSVRKVFTKHSYAPRLLPLLFFVFALASSAHASIFMRLGRGAQAMEQLGGVLLQSTDVRINGQPGKLTAFGFASAPDVLAPDLRKALALPELPSGAASVLVTHIEGSQATTLLLLPGEGPRSSVALLIEQTAEAQRKARDTPSEWPGQVAYPGATPFFSAETAQPHTALAIANTADSPEAASSRMESQLTRDGWTRVPPRTDTPGLTVYLRRDTICLFSATAVDLPGARSRITVLQQASASP